MLLLLVAIFLITLCLCLVYIRHLHHRRTSLLSYLSHEIRTPMNGIIGMSTLLDQTSLTKEQRHYLTTIRTCCDQLLQVTNSALDQPPPKPTESSPIPTLANQYPLHILLAEDNPINQQLALILLKKMGYSPDIAANGKEVLARLHDAHYDIIFMDVQMPEMDGLEATRAIRSQLPSTPANNNTPVNPTKPTCPATSPIIIAMTANTTPQDREQCLAAGMDDYLSKPIDLPELTSMLKKWAKKDTPDGVSSTNLTEVPLTTSSVTPSSTP